MGNAKRRIKSEGKADWIRAFVISIIILTIGAIWAVQKAENNLNINNKRPVSLAPKLKIEISKDIRQYNI